MAIRTPLRGIGRLIAAPLAVVLGTAALAACGSGNSENTSAKDDTAKAGAAAGAFPRTLKTAMGDVKIPAEPKRVVVLDTGELDDARR
ncbi:hypothetical protein [Streptomyces sp. MUM 136J]|uniref:hypothetical protein n=1 Tax=Streptomyces sp. MUM 136J TaxID=2791992 RepID=UPI001F036275|nr:hypothetical protein [Streptomyces sp. MUM 136J]